MSTIQSLEHHEHAEHIAHSAHEHGDHASGHGSEGELAQVKAQAVFAQWTALLVAVLAAGLAIAEQGARHAEIKVQQEAIFAADAWGQFQGKSTRATVAKDISMILGAIDVGSDPAKVAKRDAVLARLAKDQDSYENDPKDGKGAIAKRARHFEEEREVVNEQTHAYHNSSAAFELGIVLATASAITKARPLLYLACVLGIGGLALMALGYWAPEYGAI